jgi:MFS family permease
MVSGAFSLLMICNGAFSLFAGSLNDRYGPRLTLMISIIAMSAGYALMATVAAPWQLYVFYGLMTGGGYSFCYLPIASVASRWFVAKRGVVLGVTTAGVGAGALVIAPFAQVLISAFDWRISYLILAGLLIIIGLPLSRLMRLEPREKGLRPYGLEKMAADQQNNSPSFNTMDFTLKQAFRTKAFWLLFAMYVFFILPLQMVMVHLKAYAADVGIAPMIGATLVGLVGGGSILGRVVMGRLSDKIGRKTSFSIAYLLLAMMMLWLIKARQPWQFHLFSVVFGFGYGSCDILFPAITGDYFGTKYHGGIFGMVSLAIAPGGAIGPLLAGYIFDTTGSYYVAIVIGIVVLFIAAGCSLIIKAPGTPKPI